MLIELLIESNYYSFMLSSSLDGIDMKNMAKKVITKAAPPKNMISL